MCIMLESKEIQTKMNSLELRLMVKIACNDIYRVIRIILKIVINEAYAYTYVMNHVIT